MLLLYFLLPDVGVAVLRKKKFEINTTVFLLLLLYIPGSVVQKKKEKKDGAVFREEAASFNATFGPFGGQKR